MKTFRSARSTSLFAGTTLLALMSFAQAQQTASRHPPSLDGPRQIDLENDPNIPGKKQDYTGADPEELARCLQQISSRRTNFATYVLKGSNAYLGGDNGAVAHNIPSPIQGIPDFPPVFNIDGRSGGASAPLKLVASDGCDMAGFSKDGADALRQNIRHRLKSDAAALDDFDRSDKSNCLRARVYFYWSVLAEMGVATP